MSSGPLYSSADVSLVPTLFLSSAQVIRRKNIPCIYKVSISMHKMSSNFYHNTANMINSLLVGTPTAN